MSCPACKGTNLQLDNHILCLLCTDCGNLVESAQSALDFSLDTEYGRGTDFGTGRSYYSQTSTLVNRSGRSVFSESKEARWNRNLETTKVFLQAVTRNMRQPGCTERAQYILVQAMQRGRFRWGRSAERVAGASICIALREAGKAETVREVAVHIQCRQDKLARVHRQVATLLNIKLDPLDPALLVPSIWSYTQTCLSTLPEVNPPFPSELAIFFHELVPRTQAIFNLAFQLSNLVLGLSLTHGRQSASVACALLIVSLSGEAGKPVPKLNVFSSVLSARFGPGKRIIMDRVREIERVIDDWRQELPWISDLPLNQRKRTTKIAQSIKDVVAFKDDLWSKQIKVVDHPRYSPSTDGASDDDDTSCTGSTSAMGSKRSDTRASSPTSIKRRHLGVGYYDSGRPRAYVVEKSHKGGRSQVNKWASLLDPGGNPSSAAETQTVDELVRLGTARYVRDEDLFGDGELEAYIRTAPEVEALRLSWENEGRFEGVPEWTGDIEDTFSWLQTTGNDDNDAAQGEVIEVIEAWRDASPGRFDDYYDLND